MMTSQESPSLGLRAGLGWPSLWWQGALAGSLWLATAAITVGLPDTVPWDSAPLFATIMASLGGALLLASAAVDQLGRFGKGQIGRAHV